MGLLTGGAGGARRGRCLLRGGTRAGAAKAGRPPETGVVLSEEHTAPIPRWVLTPQPSPCRDCPYPGDSEREAARQGLGQGGQVLPGMVSALWPAASLAFRPARGFLLWVSDHVLSLSGHSAVKGAEGEAQVTGPAPPQTSHPAPSAGSSTLAQSYHVGSGLPMTEGRPSRAQRPGGSWRGTYRGTNSPGQGTSSNCPSIVKSQLPSREVVTGLFASQ